MKKLKLVHISQLWCVQYMILLADHIRWRATQLLSTMAVNSATRRAWHAGTLATTRHWENVSALHLHCDWAVLGCCDTRSWPDCRLQVRGFIDSLVVVVVDVIIVITSFLLGRLRRVKALMSVHPSKKKFFRFWWNLVCRTGRVMSDARRYAIWPDPRSRSRDL